MIDVKYFCDFSICVCVLRMSQMEKSERLSTKQKVSGEREREHSDGDYARDTRAALGSVPRPRSS